MKSQRLNRRQARWASELADYHFSLVHKPGSSMARADALSRRPDYDKGYNDNIDVTLLPSHLISLIQTASISSDILTDIKGKQDDVLFKVQQRQPGWSKTDGIISWYNRVYVPDIPDLRERIIRTNHDSLMTGHPGRYKTVELIQRDFWWPTVTKDVQRYILGCAACQKTKILRTKPRGLLAPNAIPDDVWDTITADLIVGLPLSRGHNAIFVVVDRLSKMVRIMPTSKKVTSEGLARHYRDYVWKDFGLPRRVISDRGSTFASDFTRELNRLLGIETHLSTAYHPQTDGQTERSNQEVELYLRLFVNERQSNWADYLPCAEFAINNRVNSATGFSPFFVNYGKHPARPLQPARQPVSRIPQAAAFAREMDAVRKEAASALSLAAVAMKRSYDQKHLDQSFRIGDLVLLDASDITSSRPSKKLDNLRYGPFKITHKVGALSYRLRLPPSWRIHDVFHVSKLSPYVQPAFPNQAAPQNDPTPVPLQPDNVPEVILEHKLLRRGNLYLVKWSGNAYEDASWTHESKIPPDDPILLDYKKENGIL
ncbi:hypothetical protein NLJ89_g11486 [Agrocybe chaxingu]|uniref:Uncharacterized protein n=1 Tax=Agrocybe chaxingu TaxID=84603 RepID=A0A9W8MPZ0_9AGAR|nr:hypothetical protein NLJ89_g11486 [Agrocybe chaxingu]